MKSSPARLVAGSLCAVLVLWPGAADAHEPEDAASARERQAELADELDHAREALEHAEAEEAELADQYRRTHARLHAVQDEAARIAESVGSVTARLTDAQGVLDEAESKMLAAARRLDRTETRLGQARDTLRRRAVAAYVGRSNPVVIAQTMLASQSVDEVNAQSTYLHAVADSHVAVVEEHRRLRLEAAALASQTQRLRAEALAQRDEVKAERAVLAGLEREQAAVVAEVAVAASEEQALLDAAAEQRATYEARVAQLQQESDSVAALLRDLQRRQAPSVGTGELTHPLPGAVLTSRYGTRVHPIYGTVRHHYGVDFGAPTGRNILAAGAGTVVHAGWRGGYGNTVIIDHGGALATLYAHQSGLAVGVGDTVAAGDTIGYVGSTGFSTGPHLHFEVRVAGNPVDPMPYL